MPRHISLERGDRGLSDSGAGWPEVWPGRPQGAGQNIFPCIRGVPHRSERTDQISQILSELLVGLSVSQLELHTEYRTRKQVDICSTCTHICAGLHSYL